MVSVLTTHVSIYDLVVHAHLLILTSPTVDSAGSNCAPFPNRPSPPISHATSTKSEEKELSNIARKLARNSRPPTLKHTM